MTNAIHAPRALEAALGYHGNAAYLGLYWTLTGHLMVGDGLVQFTAQPEPWMLWRMHEPKLKTGTLEIGGEGENAKHLLLLDRITRTCTVVAMRDGLETLRVQWGVIEPPAKPAPLTETEYQALVQRLLETRPSEATMIERRGRYHAALRALRHELQRQNVIH